MVSVRPLSVPEICGRGPSADAKSIQTMCEQGLLPVHHGPWWRSEKFLFLIGTQKSNLTLAMRVSLDTCQNNVCSVWRCCAVHRMYLCLHWMAKESSLATVLWGHRRLCGSFLTYISRFVPVTVQIRFCSSVQQCDLSQYDVGVCYAFSIAVLINRS